MIHLMDHDPSPHIKYQNKAFYSCFKMLNQGFLAKVRINRHTMSDHWADHNEVTIIKFKVAFSIGSSETY